ncbi:MAG: glycosyltransferase family 4 protein [Candidatus Riflebacteria bacterium]|nr:glycosyltransferase family 4 protein [Candidatus Riflebacteria bacterium]
MVYAALPIGSNSGWGVLGKQVVLEMARIAPTRLILPPDRAQTIDDEIDSFRIRQLLPTAQDLQHLQGPVWRLPGPVIQACFGRTLAPFVPQVHPPSQVGFAVFEENILPPATIRRARALYRHLATGSTYCADVLRQHGLTRVSVVLHGVDTGLFHPAPEPRAFLQDRFVVFSGGKFELRKGQDLVIRAYKVLQDRHRDVFLINSWFNFWPESRDTMAASRYICYQPPASNDYIGWMNGLLAANGIDPGRVITVGPRDNRLLPSVYHASDVGLFPNRVEGGTNMVLMEYLACGKPVVASYNSGHRDVLRKECAVLIEKHRPMPIQVGAEIAASWSDPDLDETIEKLEWAYRNRDRLGEMGRQGSEDMKRFPWKRVAQGLLDAVEK